MSAARPDGGSADAGPARGADAQLDAWIASRRAVEVPEGFADRVTARIASSRRERALRVAAIVVAVVAAGARIAAAFAVFITR